MADYEGVLADLKAKRAELDTAIAAIERFLPASNGRPNQPSIQAAVGNLSPRAFSGMTMPQAIIKSLKLVQQPQTKRQIQEILRAGGVKAGKSFSAHVYNTLKRLSDADGPFRRESGGQWSLREWPAVASPEASERPANDPSKRDWQLPVNVSSK